MNQKVDRKSQRLSFWSKVAAILPSVSIHFNLILQKTLIISMSNKQPAFVAQLDAHLAGDQEVAGSTPPGRQHSFLEI